MWKAACIKAGCPGRIPHDLRRTAVRNLVGRIAERVAMQMTGHNTRSMFERYNIVSEGDLRHSARKLDVALPCPLTFAHRRAPEWRAGVDPGPAPPRVTANGAPRRVRSRLP